MTLTDSPALQKSSRLRRRWLRFSLRTFLLFVTVLCVWLGLRVNEARRQKEAVAALRGLGVYVNYEHWRVNGDLETFDSTQQLDVPQWLRDVTGDEWFGRVVALRFLPPYDDEALVHLAALPDVQGLYLAGTGNNFTDAGLAHLPRPDRLVHFQASQTLVGDEFVKRLASATEMEVLSLGGTQVTDESVRRLSGLTKLKVLGLGSTQVSDEGLTVLQGMTQLAHLSLAHTRVTDTSLAHLKHAKELQFLNLEGTAVTDAGLLHLRGLPKLIVVSVDGTHVTEAGVAALKAATPSLAAIDQRRERLRKAAEEFRKRRGNQAVPPAVSASG
jgi:hypothetical protein